MTEHDQTDLTINDRLRALEHTEHATIPKEVVKEALKEWLDEKFILVGKWTVTSIMALALAALVYFMLTYHGWKHSP